MRKRRTIKEVVSLTGVGVRSGQVIRVSLAPAASGRGLRLERVDTGEGWPLDFSAARAAPGCSAVGPAGREIVYVEHLMAALAAAGITDLEVRVEGPELPLFEGSAQVWVELLAGAGQADQAGEVGPLVLTEPVVVRAGEALLMALPAEQPELLYVLDHPHPLVGKQWARFRPDRDNFAAELAPARTFITEEEARAAQAQGLLRGGSEDNAIVIYADRLSATPELPQAFARHKLLDLVGDLYLLGRPLQAQVVAYQSGHALNHRLVQALTQV